MSEYKSNTGKQLILLLIPLLCIVGAFVIVCCKVYKVKDNSMSPTLDEKNKVLVIKHREINRGDIVVFKIEDEYVIERVIGLPGEKIEITEDGTIKINEKEYKEKYMGKISNEDGMIKPYEVPEDSYYLLGDNRDDCIDSRLIGAIKEKDIIGKVVLSIDPFKSLYK